MRPEIGWEQFNQRSQFGQCSQNDARPSDESQRHPAIRHLQFRRNCECWWLEWVICSYHTLICVLMRPVINMMGNGLWLFSDWQWPWHDCQGLDDTFRPTLESYCSLQDWRWYFETTKQPRWSMKSGSWRFSCGKGPRWTKSGTKGLYSATTLSDYRIPLMEWLYMQSSSEELDCLSFRGGIIQLPPWILQKQPQKPS